MSQWTFRQLELADAEQVLQLLFRCEIAEYGEPDSDLEDLIFEWERIDLADNAWLVHDSAGRLVGYASLLPWGDDIRLDLNVDPEWADASATRELIDRCLARVRERIAGRSQGLTARLFLAHSNRRDREVAAQIGMEPGRYIFQMGIDLAERPPAPDWPAGIHVRAAIPGQDDRPLHQLIQEAFHQPGRRPQPFDEWRDYMMRPDIFDPELWFLALDGGAIAGACLAFAYPSGGWVRQLAVAESWRGRGLGKALLRAAFNALFARGIKDAGLTVESKRPDAHRFYQAVGMRQVRQYDELLVALDPS